MSTSNLADDMAHILGWLVVGLAVLASLAGLDAIANAADREWVSCGWHALVAVVLFACAVDTARRERRYKPRRSRLTDRNAR